MRHCLFVDGYGDFLGLEGKRITLKGTGKDLKFPIDELESVIITRAKGSVSLAALETLLRNGIGLSILGDKHEPLASLSPRPAKAYLINRAQHQWRENGVGAQLAQETLLGKVTAQQRIVSEMNRHTRAQTLAEKDQLGLRRALKTLKGLEEQLTLLHCTQESYETELFSLEARGAKTYWGAVKRWLPSDYHFEGRQARSSEPCAVNGALNYGYAILNARVTHLLSAEGFDPHIGYLHADSHTRASLTCDVMERYRQQYVDIPVLRHAVQSEPWRLNDQGRLDRDTKSTVARLVLEELNPREEDGLALIHHDLRALKQALIENEIWCPTPLPRRLTCPA